MAFDVSAHLEINEMRNEGIWTELGTPFDFLVRLRPFHQEAVIVRREAAEAQVRLRLKLEPGDEVPGAEALEINRAAANMAVTGLNGEFRRPSEEMMQAARKLGLNVSEVDGVDGKKVPVVIFSGEEKPEDARNFFQHLLAKSTPALHAIVAASRKLNKVPDEEIAKLGKDFIFGRHLSLDWAD